MEDDDIERSKLVRIRAIACEHRDHVMVPERARNLLSIIEIIGYWTSVPENSHIQYLIGTFFNSN